MIIRQARTILGEAAFVAAWEAGQALTLDQAIVYALEPPVVVPLSMVDSTR
jgi:hypothetical protein